MRFDPGMSMAEIVSRINATAARHVGTVRFFYPEKGWGFFKREGGESDVFVHIKELQKSGIASLKAEQRAEFEINDGPRGPVASNIRPLSLAGEI